MVARKLSTPSRRRKMREALWPDSSARVFPREGGTEKGWFSAPRTLPLVLALLDDKSLAGKMDLTRTYVGLLADNYGEGLIEIGDESHYALLAGLKGARGVRSWRERVRQLATLGFIAVHDGLGGRIGFVMIIHPDIAIRALHAQGRVPKEWWAEYLALWLKISGPHASIPDNATATGVASNPTTPS